WNFQKSSVHPKLFGRAIVQRASQTRQSPRRRFANQARIKSECVAMRTFHNSSFDPQTLLLLETAFDEAWLTLKFVGNKTVKADELARSVLRGAMEGERDPIRLQDGALERLLPATNWREVS